MICRVSGCRAVIYPNDAARWEGMCYACWSEWLALQTTRPQARRRSFRWGRWVAFTWVWRVVAVLVGVATFCLVIWWASKIIWPEPPNRTVMVTIQPGDTLWYYGRRYRGEFYILQWLAEARRMNDVEPGRLRPGDVLKLPDWREVK